MNIKGIKYGASKLDNPEQFHQHWIITNPISIYHPMKESILMLLNCRIQKVDNINHILKISSILRRNVPSK